MAAAVRKLVLAYSGGLDTSVILRWVKDCFGCEVIAYCADVGQGEETVGLEQKALATGAARLYVEDLREEFAREFIFPMMRANAVYESYYLLGTSIARPAIARKQVEIALREGADAVAHGATGKGNDQVRFELTFARLAPQLTVVAPWRHPQWPFKGRADMIAYATEKRIPVPVTAEKPYSMDRNLVHVSYEGGVLEDPWREPYADMFRLTVAPEDAPDRPEYVEIEYQGGDPIAINGAQLSPARIIEQANQIGGRHGIGRVDLVENRFVGIKSRGVYEAPGMELLGSCYGFLLQLILDRRSRELFDQLSLLTAKQIYQGYGYDFASRMIRDALRPVTELMTGTIAATLYKGTVTFQSAKDVPHSLYSEANASMEAIGEFDHADSEGFLRVLSVSARALAAAGQIRLPG